MTGPISTASSQAALAAAALIPDVMRGMASCEPLAVQSVAISPLDGKLSHPFVIASDASKQERVDNVMVALEVKDGIVGCGEAAPYKGISGDSQEILRNDIRRVLPHICHCEMTPLTFSNLLRDAVRYPAARAALEMAFLDAHAKYKGLSLCKFLSPQAAVRKHITDVTIPILSADEAAELALKYRSEGFERIKVKVGRDLEQDFDRLEAIVGAYAAGGLLGELEILLDANEGYVASDAIALLDFMKSRLDIAPLIFEQPVGRDDIDGMKQMRIAASAFGTKVFADESVFNCRDLFRLIEAEAADGINLKIMKHGGIIETLKIAERAIHAGLELMIGGMVETTLAMTASLHLAQLIDPVWLDLDTPLLMNVRTIRGGMIYEGASMMLPSVPGIGVHPLFRI
jgi:L-alanine-DL-glutamate epimerase-like enolase superfamily enzyme